MKSKAFSGMMLILFITSILTLALNIQPVKASGNIYNGDWLYRKAHNLTGSTEGYQAYYQMKVIVHYGNGIDSGENVYLNSHSQTDFDDIRFTWYNSSSDSEVECDYWLEEKHDQDSATFWIEIPEISNVTDNTIYVYFGNSTVSTTSNGDNTFLFFDDFDNVNLPEWTIMDDAYISRTVENSYIKFTGTNVPEEFHEEVLYASLPLTDNFIAESKATIISVSGIFKTKVYTRLSNTAQKEIGAINWIYVAESYWRGDFNYLFWLRKEQGEVYTSIYAEGTWDTSYHIYGISKTRTTIKGFLDYVNKSSNTINFATNYLIIAGRDDYGTIETRYQWARLRKYVDPEPSHGSWGSEERLVPSPIAKFGYSPTSPKINEVVTFDASDSLPGWNGTHHMPIVSYKWDFGDGTTATGVTAIHTYTAEGTYTVTLNVTDSQGLWNTTSKTLTVSPSPTAGGWLYRKAHNITGSTEGDQTYYQMKVIVHYGNGIDSGENVYLNGHSQRDFDDIRFTWYNSLSDSEVECDYWLEEKHDQDNATFWVEIPEINNVTDNTIYIYYSNQAVSTTSNGTNAFCFFDDFEDGTIDAKKWATYTSGPGSITESGGLLNVDVNGGIGSANAIGKTFLGYGYGFMLRAKESGSTNWRYARVGMSNDTGMTTYNQISWWFRHYPESPCYGVIKTGTGSGASYTTQSIVFHVYRGARFSSSLAKFWYDDSYVGQLTTNVPTVNLPAWLTAIVNDVGTTENVDVDWVAIKKWVDPEPTHGSWGSEEILVPYVVIDRAYVSDERADVGSVQSIGFHAKWDNGSDAVGGEIYVNGTKYITNNAGWIFFNAVSSVVGRETWIVTGVNCSGVTLYVQTAPTPSIVWDQIKIVDGGVTKESVMVGEMTTIWFRAMYEYDGVFFEDANGVLYVNGSQMSWSTNNRWEYNYTAAVHGSKAFIITGVSDNLYGLTVINDPVGAQTITVLGQPTLTVSLDSSTTYVGYKVKISGKLSYPIDTGISGANLFLAYSVTGGESWNDITSVTTTAEGDYFVEWMPTATGNYLVRVSWEGNETLYIAGTEVYSNLAVIPVEGKYVFSVISNSTVSELAFNSTSRVLSFTVSGPSGTTGYTKVTIAKTLIGDINELKVYLDGNQISYAVISTEDSFLLDFTYQHSAHEVVVSLGPPPFIPPQLITSLSLGILAVALAVATAILISKIRRRTPTTILDNVLK